MNKAIIFLILFLQLTSCVDEILGGDKNLNVKNNTSERIYFWYSGEYANYHYPDTILPIERPIQIGQAAPNNGSGSGPMNPNWEQIYSQLPDGKLSVYFFETNPQTQEQWDEIRNNPEMVYRKDTTLEELRNNDYTIEYP